MCKETVFLKEIFFNHLGHLPIFATPEMRQGALDCPWAYKIERLTELALAAVGGYKFVDKGGYDFDDFSDSKTTSLNENTLKFEIGSVETKIGALRICCFNIVDSSIDYFFVPGSRLAEVSLPCYGKNSHKRRIVAQYNVKWNDYNKFEEFRINDFVTLAKIPG